MPTDTFKPLDAITKFLRRFVVFNDPDHATVLALWVLHTWAFDAAYATPYLYVNSAEPQSGKTRVLEVTQLLTRNSETASNMSSAALFSLMDNASPTVFIDEVDSLFTGAANEEMRGVLNSGYKQGGSVKRFLGALDHDGSRQVATFYTFCPKMLVGIDNAQMPDTLRDRCIPIDLKRKRTTEEVERFQPRKIEDEAENLRREIERWANTNMEKIMSAPDPAVIDGISDRKFEIAEPLLTLARVCKAEAPTRKALGRLLAGKAPALSIGIQTLQAAKQMMDEGGVDRIASANLAAHMDLNTKKLGIVLAAYEIRPGNLRFASGERVKGYNRRDFKDAWERYL